MKYSEFEKHIKVELKNDEMPLDTDALIARLGINKKKKRRFLPFWIFLSGVAIAGMVYIGNLNPNSKFYNSEAHSNLSQYDKEDEIIGQSQDFPASSDEKNTILSSSTMVEEEENKTSTPSEVEAQTSYTNSSYLSIIELEENTKVLNKEETQQSLIMGSSESNQGELGNADFLSEERSTSSKINAIENLSFKLDQEAPQFIMNRVVCPDFKERRRFFDVEVLAELGYFYPNKSFGEAKNAVDEKRLLEEDSKEGIHAGIYAKFIGRKIPLYLQTGLSVDYLTERMYLSYNYIQRDTSQGIISITESENGDTLTVIKGDIVTETEVSGFKKKHYRLRSLDIPVVLGYQWSFNRFTVGLEGGVLLNLQMRSTGSLLTDELTFESLENGQQFKSNIGMSYLGGISVGFHLAPRHKIYANAKFRMIPDEVNAAPVLLSQKYDFIGANIGYGYLF